MSVTDRTVTTVQFTPRIATAEDMRRIRGLRNNNPLNIKRNPKNNWVGRAAEQDDPVFEKFVSIPYGIRAAVIILMNYRDKRNARTLYDFISTWAPDSENNVSAYMNTVIKLTGWTYETVVDVYDPDMLFALLDAMIVHENGVRLPAHLIREGMQLAGFRKPPRLSETPRTTTGKAAIGVGSAVTIGASAVTTVARQIDDLSLMTQLIVLVVIGVLAVGVALFWRAQRE